jgi:hypothetical protein
MTSSPTASACATPDSLPSGPRLVLSVFSFRQFVGHPLTYCLESAFEGGNRSTSCRQLAMQAQLCIVCERARSETPIDVANACSSAVYKMNKLGSSTDLYGTEYANLMVADDEACLSYRTDLHDRHASSRISAVLYTIPLESRAIVLQGRHESHGIVAAL